MLPPRKHNGSKQSKAQQNKRQVVKDQDVSQARAGGKAVAMPPQQPMVGRANPISEQEHGCESQKRDSDKQDQDHTQFVRKNGFKGTIAFVPLAFAWAGLAFDAKACKGPDQKMPRQSRAGGRQNEIWLPLGELAEKLMRLLRIKKPTKNQADNRMTQIRTIIQTTV